MPPSKTIFLELNEVNFEFLEAYIGMGHLPNFRTFFDAHGYAMTTSENRYEELEPWIQWVTAHTGKSLDQHGIFRLGDIRDADIEQIWERLANRGIKVGAMSPMNAKCRGEKLDFFVPDPWTDTNIIANPIIRRMYSAIVQMVNDNAHSKITVDSLFGLSVGYMTYASLKNYGRYFRYVFNAKSNPWFKSIFLDQLLSDTYIKCIEKNNTQFSSIFLNAAAHIQHHYMFSSAIYAGNLKNPEWYILPNNDPLLDVYSSYDLILGDIITKFPDARIMLATGLHQVPHAKLTFYWRLKNHADFLGKLGISFTSVEPRMSRDFLLRCADAERARQAEHIFKNAVVDGGEPLFEVDNRGADLFVALSYPKEITKATKFHSGERTINGLIDDVAFVAIKNGQHDGIGYFSDSGLEGVQKGETFALTEMPDRVMQAVCPELTHA